MAPGCAACGRSLDADARFCKHCGQAVAGALSTEETVSGATSARERKVATLLFADIVGFTELGERLDAEVVSRLVFDTFERLSGEVDRYGGTVEKFAGDALLAVFGVPTTHEDDPERAVRAALEMQSAVAHRGTGHSALQLRIGIETGEVLADLGRSTGERDLFVTGDAVNTAARLQAGAEPGAVVVGPTTYAGTRALVEYEELAPLDLKGKALPIVAWRATRVRARRGGLRAPLGLEAALIGRDEELALLKDTVRRTVAEGRPHMLTVSGEAGVGKTRLIWELEKYLDGLPDTLHWRKGRCYSYASVSYSPLVEAVKADAHISDDDSPATMVLKLDARVTDLVPATGIGSVRSALRALLGVSDGATLVQDELFEAWRAYLAAMADRHPLVLVFEDLHWADDATLDFVEFMARWGDAPIVLLCTARPGLLERRTTWGGGIPNASLVQLAPLEADESATLVDALLDGALPDELARRVVEMANGNPLFAEELVRMFIDQGALRQIDGVWRFVGVVTDSTIPSSVQAVLSARLDVLDVEEKRVAQEASVVGRIFWDVVVASLRNRPVENVSNALRGLRVKELVAPRVPSTMAGASEWSFHHVLVRDVAYESLPKADRAELHLQVARWAETESPDRLDEFAELVAAHRLAALRYEDELAGTDAPGAHTKTRLAEALAASIRAARRAAAVFDPRAARRWQLVAIEMADRLGRPPLQRGRLALDFLVLTQGELDSRERIEVLSAGVRLVEGEAGLDRSGRALLGELRSGLAQALAEDGRIDQAKSLLRQSIADLEPDRPSAARAAAARVLSWVLWHAYEFDDGAALAHQAMEEASAAGDEATYRTALLEAGVILSYQGHVEVALARIEESMRLAQEAGDRKLQLRGAVNLSAVRQHNGFPVSECLSELEPAIATARRSGAYHTLAFMLSNLADAYRSSCRFEEVLDLNAEELEVSARAGNPHMVPSIHLQRADSLYALGRISEAEASVLEAEATMTDDPQLTDRLPTLRALLRFGSDAPSALRTIVEARITVDSGGHEAWELAMWQCRTAFRLSDTSALRDGRDALRVVGQIHGPGRARQLAWAQALEQSDVDRIHDVAAEFEEAGLLRSALEALADEALAAARLGRSEGRSEALQVRCEELGYYPAFGPLPETRWFRPAAGRAEDAVTA